MTTKQKINRLKELTKASPSANDEGYSLLLSILEDFESKVD